jgi:carboxymethylenebutenolidase
MEDSELCSSIEQYRRGRIDRRDLLQSLIALTGSYMAAHLFLESSGLAASLVSQVETQRTNLDAQTVRYPSGQVQVEAYLVKPNHAGRNPAVIVIHENRGLNEHIRDVARRFATEGFLALAPDLLSRVGGTASMRTPQQATEAINDIPASDSVEDLKAGFVYLAGRPEADPEKISSIGFCWGGWRSFMLATEEPRLRRSVVFYGSTPTRGLEKIQAPVLAHYAQLDHRITGNALNTDKAMGQFGKKYTYHVYPGAYHAFFNDTGPRHDTAAAKLAWERTLEFLRYG